MVDTRFYNIAGPYKISEIARCINCEIQWNNFQEDIDIFAVRPLKEAGAGDISFLNNKKYINEFKNTKASACIVASNFATDVINNIVLLKTKNPYFTYAKLIDLFYSSAKKYPNKLMPSAYIAASASIGNNCYIGHNAVIEDNVTIGDDCIIESGVFIDAGVVIGKRAKIYSNVSISYAEIGDDAVILAGAKIGQDGFGFATEAGMHRKIYHTGKVLIGNNVEIGANSTIDRGSINDTIIEDFCRIDNLVQIGHNVRIGRGSVIVAQVGIAGSSKVGQYCVFGGQVGIAGHVEIGNQVQIASQAGVIKNIEDGAIVGGSPAMPIKDWHRQSIIMKKLVKSS